MPWLLRGCARDAICSPRGVRARRLQDCKVCGDKGGAAAKVQCEASVRTHGATGCGVFAVWWRPAVCDLDSLRLPRLQVCDARICRTCSVKTDDGVTCTPCANAGALAALPYSVWTAPLRVLHAW